jgi:hypothetical protein
MGGEVSSNEAFQTEYRTFIGAIKTLSQPPEMQCKSMGNIYNRKKLNRQFRPSVNLKVVDMLVKTNEWRWLRPEAHLPGAIRMPH